MGEVASTLVGSAMKCLHIDNADLMAIISDSRQGKIGEMEMMRQGDGFKG